LPNIAFSWLRFKCKTREKDVLTILGKNTTLLEGNIKRHAFFHHSLNKRRRKRTSEKGNLATRKREEGLWKM